MLKSHDPDLDAGSVLFPLPTRTGDQYVTEAVLLSMSRIHIMALLTYLDKHECRGRGVYSLFLDLIPSISQIIGH